MEKLQQIQERIRVGKGRYNDFSKFYYRSCEDICRALREIESEMKCAFIMNDEILEKAGLPTMTAHVTYVNLENNNRVEGRAEVIIEVKRKGMTSEQASGAASSYARKIALAGLLLLDDEKDPDTPAQQDASTQYVQAIRQCTDPNQLQDYLSQLYAYDPKAYAKVEQVAMQRMNELTTIQ